MAEVTGSIGGQPVELDNAATEATLRQLLAAMNRQTQVLGQAMKAPPGGGGGGGGAGPGAAAAAAAAAANNNLGKSSSLASKAGGALSAAMGPLAKVAGVLGGVLGDLVASGVKTIGNLADFAGQLMDGTGGLSGFFGALKDLPFGLGAVAGLFEKIAKMQEAELKTYRDLTKAGVNFGGSLNDIRSTALGLGMTMDEYAGVIKKNQSALVMLGGSTNDGAMAFNKIAKQLRDSPMGEQLRGMGITGEEAAAGLGSYIKMTGARSKEELKNTTAIAESAGRYMKSLDALSQLTGESKEALEAKMAEEAQEAQFQSYLSTLDEKSREKAMEGLKESLARGGKGAAQAFKDQVQGLPPMTEAGQQFVAQSKAGADAVNTLANNVKDSTKTAEDQKKAGDALTVGLAKEHKERGTLNAALARSGGAAGDVANAQARAASQAHAAGTETVEQATAARKKIEEQQNKLAESAAGRAAEAEKAFKDMGAMIYGMLQPALAAIIPLMQDMAQSFMGFVKDNMPAIKKALTDVAEFATKFVKNMFSEDGRAKIVNDLTYYLKLMMIEVKKALLPKIMYSDADAEADKKKLDLEKQSYDKKAEAAQIEMENSKKLEALKVAKDEKERAKVEGEKAKAEADIKKLEDLKKGGTKLDSEQQKQLDEAQATLKKKQEILALSKDENAMKAAATAQGNASTLRSQGAAAADAAKDSGQSNRQDMTDWSAAGGLSGAKGGIFNGPESGYMVQMHGNEAIVPMDNLKASKTPLPDFNSLLAGAGGAMGDAANAQASASKGMDISSMFGDMAKSLGLPIGGAPSAQAGSSDNLLKELQTLNKQTTEMLRYMKLTHGESRDLVSNFKSLSGNLYT